MGYRNIFLINGCKLCVKNNQLVLEKDECRYVPIEDINSLVIDNMQTVITSNALAKLSENNVTVIVTDKSHMPCTALLPVNSYCRQLQMLNSQISSSKVFLKQLWKSIIVAKISNQYHVLNILNINNRDELAKYPEMVKSGDSSNIEAIAAHKYFRLLFGETFTRSKDNLINAHLNYGYSILRSAIAKQLYVSGFEPSLGIFHHNELNNFNLADDIIEPFRPIVDLFAKINTTGRDPCESLTVADRAGLVNLLNADVLLDNKKYALSYAIELVVSALAKRYKDQNSSVDLPTIIPLENHRYE